MKVKHIILGAVAVAILGAGGTAIVMQPKPITLESPKEVVWQKPSTDAEWAEDTKKESLDIRANDVLDTMVASHTAKLEKEQKAFQQYADMEKAGDDPVKYIYWQKRTEFQQSYPDMKESELDSEAQKAAQTEYNQKLWEIEKLQQSIERMDKEIELRKSGYLIVEDANATATPTGIFGATIPAERIRHIP